jgi:hypothetical protein
MAITVTPLSRRPWWLWLMPLLPGLGLWQLLVGTQHDTKLPVVTQWGMGAWLLFGLGALLWQAATMPITDYDANYLYLFTKAGPEQIPLASFYKLQEGNRGYWSLYYYGEQRRKKKLSILPLGRQDTSSIHGFIDAIWQHNPQLALKYNWWFK